MYVEPQKTVEELLKATLQSYAADFPVDLTRQFRENGYPALMLGKREHPGEPQVVVFEDPKYAVVYLLSDPALNDAEFEVFQKKARSFAWEHDAAAYFIRITRETC